LITPRILVSELDLTRLGWLVNSTWRLLGLYLPVCVYQINVTYRSHAKYRQMLGPSHIYICTQEYVHAPLDLGDSVAVGCWPGPNRIVVCAPPMANIQQPTANGKRHAGHTNLHL